MKFIIICAESEIDERIRECTNVIIAKDFRTKVDQDLTLIDGAAIHMGAASGPGTIALFSSKPYLMVNSTPGSIINIGFVYNENAYKAKFANTLQNFTITPETLNLLIHEFEKMWEAVDISYWEKKMNMYKEDTSFTGSWLR